MDCNPPSSPVHGILQARILEWVASPFSKGSFQLRDGTRVCCIAWSLYHLSDQGGWYPMVGQNLTSEMWIRPTQKQEDTGLFVVGSQLSFLWPITLDISSQQSETSESSFCHILIQCIFIEHLLHVRCSWDYGREHDRHALWPSGVYILVGCPSN